VWDRSTTVTLQNIMKRPGRIDHIEKYLHTGI